MNGHPLRTIKQYEPSLSKESTSSYHWCNAQG